MTLAASELDDFVFKRRAIAGTVACDSPGIDGGPVSAGSDYRMTLGCSTGNMTCNLAVLYPLSHDREDLRRDVAPLWLQLRTVDSVPVETRRGPGFQSAERKSNGVETSRQHNRRRASGTPGWRSLLSNMNDASQKGAGG